MAHPFYFSKLAGRGTNTLRTPIAIIFSAECKLSLGGMALQQAEPFWAHVTAYKPPKHP